MTTHETSRGNECSPEHQSPGDSEDCTLVYGSLAAARATIASSMLGEPLTELRIGAITLHPHQGAAVARIRRTLATNGGALLCDAVGLGKTYVALAVAMRFDRVAIIAPASLADMWRQALSATHFTAEFISIESLGRNGPPNRRRSLLVVDEAHHFRNSCTRRYSELARMCMLSRVLFLSATPLHNSRDDLSALVALFAGVRAYGMSDADMAQLIVRRGTIAGAASDHIPIVQHVQPRVLSGDESMLDRVLSLPPPVPPSDGSVATRLVRHGLVRQWVSSNAALAAALRRRIGRSHGLLASLDAGRYPTAAELSAWVFAEDTVQLAFPELLLPAPNTVCALDTLAATLRTHVKALAELLAATRQRDDAPIADFVRSIRAQHPGERMVAFSCYAETATALYYMLKNDGHAALLTARGTSIASGPIARVDILRQFAPGDRAQLGISDHETVRLLIATDLLSEGVNLHEASIVVHLDLPWTAARLQQRIGRLARLGSRHPRVLSYSVHPPPRAESLLHEVDIIARKANVARSILGTTQPAPFTRDTSEPATLVCGEHIQEVLERWRQPDHNNSVTAGPVVAVASPRSDTPACGIGAWIVDGVPTLLSWDAHYTVSTEPHALMLAVQAADTSTDGASGAMDAADASHILAAARAWYDQRKAWLAVSGGIDSPVAPSQHDARRSLAHVADVIAGDAGFARRGQSSALATRLRNAATQPLPLMLERTLGDILGSHSPLPINGILDMIDQGRVELHAPSANGFDCVALISLTPG